MATAEAQQLQRPAARRTLYCYAHEHLTRTLRGLTGAQETAYAVAVERGYELGPLFLEEDSSGSGMQALVDALTLHDGAVAVAMPHRGHLIPLGGPQTWQTFLEVLTGHPVVFTSRTH